MVKRLSQRKKRKSKKGTIVLRRDPQATKASRARVKARKKAIEEAKALLPGIEKEIKEAEARPLRARRAPVSKAARLPGVTLPATVPLTRAQRIKEFIKRRGIATPALEKLGELTERGVKKVRQISPALPTPLTLATGGVRIPGLSVEREAKVSGVISQTVPFFSPIGPALITTTSIEQLTTTEGKEGVKAVEDFFVRKGAPKPVAKTLSLAVPVAGLALGLFGLGAQAKSLSKLAKASKTLKSTSIRTTQIKGIQKTKVLKALERSPEAQRAIASKKLTATRIYRTKDPAGDIIFVEFAKAKGVAKGVQVPGFKKVIKFPKELPGRRFLVGVQVDKNNKIIQSFGGLTIEKVGKGGSRSITKLIRTAKGAKPQLFEFAEKTKLIRALKGPKGQLLVTESKVALKAGQKVPRKALFTKADIAKLTKKGFKKQFLTADDILEANTILTRRPIKARVSITKKPTFAKISAIIKEKELGITRVRPFVPKLKTGKFPRIKRVGLLRRTDLVKEAFGPVRGRTVGAGIKRIKKVKSLIGKPSKVKALLKKKPTPPKFVPSLKVRRIPSKVPRGVQIPRGGPLALQLRRPLPRGFARTVPRITPGVPRTTPLLLTAKARVTAGLLPKTGGIVGFIPTAIARQTIRATSLFSPSAATLGTIGTLFREATKTLTRDRQRLDQPPITDQRIGIEQIPKPFISTKQAIQQKVGLVTQTQLLQITPTTTQVITTQTPQTPKTPKRLPLPVFGKKPKVLTIPPLAQKTSRGWNTLIKPQGKKKFIKANLNPLLKKKALALGSFVVDHSLGGTFKVIPTKKPARPAKIKVPLNYFGRNIGKFREFKRVKGKAIFTPNTFIERRKHRLDTPSEVKRITVAKKLAQLKKLSLTKRVKPLIKRRRK